MRGFRIFFRDKYVNVNEYIYTAVRLLSIKALKTELVGMLLVYDVSISHTIPNTIISFNHQ